MLKINNCISVCTQKDIYVWSIASDNILKYIDAENYIVIVPSKNVDLFRKITDSRWDIVDENIFAPEFSLKYVRDLMPDHKKNRAGWYYQQLLKIKALSQSKSNMDINLIWDADTVPLKSVNFIKDDKLIYYTGTEHHKPYFVCTNKLMGLGKLVDFSFISQNFVAKSSWVNDFLSMLSNRFQDLWFNAILNNINFEENSGFSEYETLGNYFAKHYFNEMLVCRSFWKRNGSEICHIDDLDLYEICRIPDKPLFVSYEFHQSASNFQRLLGGGSDDDTLLLLIGDKRQSKKWQRFKHFSELFKSDSQYFEEILENQVRNKDCDNCYPISCSFL